MADKRILVRLLTGPDLKSEPIDEETAKQKLGMLAKIVASGEILVQITDTIVVRKDQLVSASVVSPETTPKEPGRPSPAISAGIEDKNF
jgi:hypothetical protein